MSGLEQSVSVHLCEIHNNISIRHLVEIAYWQKQNSVLVPKQLKETGLLMFFQNYSLSNGMTGVSGRRAGSHSVKKWNIDDCSVCLPSDTRH